MVSLIPSSLTAAWPRLIFYANPDTILQSGEVADRNPLGGLQSRQDGHLIRAARAEFHRAALDRGVVHHVHDSYRSRRLNRIGRQIQARDGMHRALARRAREK